MGIALDARARRPRRRRRSRPRRGRARRHLHRVREHRQRDEPGVRPAHRRRQPADGQDVGIRSTPALGDLDGDGDLDLVAGEHDGTFVYFENTGSAATRLRRRAPAPPIRSTARTSAIASTPALGDLDGDGDLDLVAGEQLRHVPLLREHRQRRRARPSSRAPAPPTRSTARTSAARSTPALGDLDGDGDLDLRRGRVRRHLLLLREHRQRDEPGLRRAHRRGQPARRPGRRDRLGARARRPRRRRRPRPRRGRGLRHVPLLREHRQRGEPGVRRAHRRGQSARRPGRRRLLDARARRPRRRRRPRPGRGRDDGTFFATSRTPAARRARPSPRAPARPTRSTARTSGSTRRPRSATSTATAISISSRVRATARFAYFENIGTATPLRARAHRRRQSARRPGRRQSLAGPRSATSTATATSISSPASSDGTFCLLREHRQRDEPGLRRAHRRRESARRPGRRRRLRRPRSATSTATATSTCSRATSVGDFVYFENTGNATSPAFVARPAPPTRSGVADVGSAARRRRSAISTATATSISSRASTAARFAYIASPRRFAISAIRSGSPGMRLWICSPAPWFRGIRCMW